MPGAGCTHNAVGVKERHTRAGRDYLALDSAIGSGLDSGLEMGLTVNPAFGAHGISTLVRRGLLEDNVHDNAGVSQSGSRADEAVGAREAIEDMFGWLPKKVCGQHRIHSQGEMEGGCVFNGSSIILAEALTALQIVSKLTSYL
ncbi:hypothetical protein B0H16DRAFT_1464997 [Mycena metata]|uniref:Uncharacterized protein n=1 Tax=Mycena metata TaxID=1033252 RepID=A0AAD7ICL7_9AGAR|nr:hypothetical protein B0H16DRAFT_1464997 [Mycena metata]